MRLRLLATLACLIPSAAFGDASIPALPVPSGGVMIFNQGTAELAGYRIVVASTGDSVAIDGAGRGDRRLSAQLTQALFADLAAAMPLSKLNAATCPPGSTPPIQTFVTYRGERSPDLACATDPQAAALYNDVQSIAHALYVANYRSRAISRYGTGGQAGGAVTGAQSGQGASTPSGPLPGYGGYGNSY